MSVEFKEIPLTNLITFVKKNLGMSYEKLKYYEDKNGIPVYTANKDFIIKVKKFNQNELILASPNNKILSYAKDGDGTAGTNIIIHTEPFYIGSHREAIKMNNFVLVDYIYYQIKDMKKKYEFNHAKAASQREMKNVMVLMPLKKDGTFDVEKQKELVKKYKKIDINKKALLEKQKKINDISIRFENNIKFKEIALSELIDFSKCKTNGSFFTKSIINQYKGNIPVYGASNIENEVGYGYVKDNLVIKDKKRGLKK